MNNDVLFEFVNVIACLCYIRTLRDGIATEIQYFSPPQVTIYVLENLSTVLTKCSADDMRLDVLPMVFSALESNSLQVQDAAIKALGMIQTYLSDAAIRNLVLPKAKALFTKSTCVKVS